MYSGCLAMSLFPGSTNNTLQNIEQYMWLFEGGGGQSEGREIDEIDARHEHSARQSQNLFHSRLGVQEM
jgi:hypothetical protein